MLTFYQIFGMIIHVFSDLRLRKRFYALMNQSHAIQEPVQQFRRQQADTKDHEEKHHA